jgi:hypothetical protein
MWKRKLDNEGKKKQNQKYSRWNEIHEMNGEIHYKRNEDIQNN